MKSHGTHGQDYSPSKRQCVLYHTGTLARCYLKYKCFAKNTWGLIPFLHQALYIAVAGVSDCKGSLTTLMPPCLESENVTLATKGIQGLLLQQVFLTDALMRRLVSWIQQDSPKLRIWPTCAQTWAKLRHKECTAHPWPCSENKSFGSPWALFPEPTHPLHPAGAKSHSCTQHKHDISPLGSCKSSSREAKLGSQRSTLPRLGASLTVWRLAQGVHISRAADPPWQGAKQLHKSMSFYAFWLRLLCRCTDGACQWWQ